MTLPASPKPYSMPFSGLPELAALADLRARPQWVAWGNKWGTERAAWAKVPVCPRNGMSAKSNTASTWGTYEEAAARVRRNNLDGVGFMLADDDDLTGIDLDKVRDPVSGEFEQWAVDLLANAETYAEISPSGRGIRMFARGKVDAALKSNTAGVEIYGRGRYLTVTGCHLDGTPEFIAPAPRTIEALRARVEAHRPSEAPAPSRPSPTASIALRPAPGPAGETDIFSRIKTAALQRLDAWVPALFSGAEFQPGTGAYRISSRELGRDLQEDLSIAPNGIVDFGVHDMGDPNQGRRTAIDVLMEHGGAPDAFHAARWLAERLGIDFDAEWGASRADPDIDLSRLRISSSTTIVVPDEDDIFDDEADIAKPIDAALTHVDGVLGEIVDWIADCDPEGNRLLALAAALPLMGTLLGRRMATPTRGGGGLELYVISLLPSGGGKSVAMDGIIRILEVAGLDNQHLAAPKFRSGAAFGDVICRNPLAISIVDEIADYLGAFLSDRRQNHQVELEEYLKEQWGKGFKSFRTAHSKSSSSAKVWAPCYSIYGTTTPEALFRVIKSQHITGGFVNPFTVMNATGQERPHKPSADVRHPPDRLIEGVRAMYAFGAPGRGNMGVMDKNAAQDPEPVIVPWQDQSAEDRYLAFEAEFNVMKNTLGDLGKIYSRTSFMAVKMATIRACGRMSPVTLADIEWGIAIASQSADLFRAELAGKMLDPLSAGELLQKIADQFRRPTKKGQDLMAKYGTMTLPRRFLWENLKHHTNRHPGELDSALKALEANGVVHLHRATVPGAKDIPIVTYRTGRRRS